MTIELHHLRQLTRPVARAGPLARAIAVYSEPAEANHNRAAQTRPARDQGFEGVACVDDAARAVVLYSRIWRRQRAPSARTAASGLLRFLAYMQDDDGRFGNFIVEWDGRRNRVGATSHPGGPAWQARAIHALACGIAITGEEEWDERFRRALTWIDDASPYLDVRAVAVLAVLEHWRATGAPSSAERAVTWSLEIARHTSGAKLLNAAGVEPIHLWGHLQEAALAETGSLFDQPVLVEGARASADALLLPAIESAFEFERVLPFDVSCTVAGLAAVARATSDERYATAAALGREWFYGRNTADQPVYDAPRGLVYDGIDHGVVNRNSGAESNIEGALALLG
ncbi:MAG: hypothetical protein NVSMB2_05540 [Chloroflexota bacterium]